jgi:GDP-L-fucose synthase
MMNKQAKIYVAGHRGLVGSAIMRALKKQDYHNITFRTHAELDLTDTQAVKQFFEIEKPEYVFFAAAKVGGIQANNIYPADFIRENINIQQNLIHQAYLTKVKRLLFLGSSCIYPKDCPQPIKEEYLLTGLLEPTNRPYALAKIAGIEMCWAYNRQYGTKYLAAMPTNLYGQNDNYNLQNSHVLPALIRKFHEAKVQNKPYVEAWGTGKPRREFLYSDDMADACLFLMNLPEAKYNPLVRSVYEAPLINVGCGEDVTIKELTELVQQVIYYRGDIKWDATKPDGTMRKLMDVEKLKNLGWSYQTSLESGIALVYQSFQKDCTP